jgi:hypothetical protein
LAIQKPQLNLEVLDNPVWPDRLPGAEALQLVYGNEADELVVHFVNVRYRNPVYVLISTPDYEYTSVEVDGVTGEVIGVMVYPLAAYAVEKHPAWRAATKPNPDLSVAALIVSDIRNLFNRYGIEPTESEHD